MLTALAGISAKAYAIDPVPVHESIEGLQVVQVNQSSLDFRSALAAAYKNSEGLKIAQEVFLQEIEQMSNAISKFLPDIDLVISNEDTKATNTSYLDQPGSQKISTTTRNLALQQNLFRGGSDVAAVKAAQSSYRASRAKLYNEEQKILIAALDDYMSFYQAKETYDVMETALEFNSKQLKMANERFNLGEATKTDVAQAEAAYADAESSKLVAYSNLESARAQFIKTFATEPVNIVLPNAPSGLPESLDALTAKALISNFTIQQVKNSVAAAKASALSAKGKLLPNLDFKARLGSTYNNPESRGGPQNEYQAATNHRAFSTSLSLRVPIFSQGGVEYSNIRKGNSESRRMAHQLDDVLANVKTNAISSWTGYNAAKSAIVSADQAVDAYALVLEGIGYEYDVGSKAVLDVLKAQKDLNDIKIKSIKVKKDCITSAYQMKALTGEMTAVALKLPVKYFNPGTEFRKVKAKIIGF